MTVMIVDATIRMLDELSRIEQQSFEEEAFSDEQIGYFLTDYNSIGLAAKVDDEIVGFIIARIDFIRNNLIGHIITIDVAAKFRRRGIGQRLMLEIESVLKHKGVNEIRLEVREGNFAAIALYEKLGYKRLSMLENYYGKAHGFYFKKSLR